MPTRGVQVEAGMLARHGGVHEDDIVIQGPPDGCAGVREQVHQPLFWQPAGGIAILEICGGVRRQAHPDYPQHAVILLHVTADPSMFSRFHRIKVARGGQCLQFGARASLPELPGVH